MRLLSGVGLLLSLVVAGAVAADPIPMPPELAKFLSSPDEGRMIGANALRDWNLVVPGCGNPRLKSTNVVVQVQPEFDAAGKPTSGKWQVLAHLEGCGQSRQLNLFYAFASNGQMVRVSGLPGTTRADLVLQKDGLTYAAIGMGKLVPSTCKDFKDFKYLDTAFEAPGPSRSWTEKWTVRACGVDGIVRMQFAPKPDATGTSISVNLNETVRGTSR
jgi:hypothetical protein